MGEKGSLLYELNCRLDQLRKVVASAYWNSFRVGVDEAASAECVLGWWEDDWVVYSIQ